MQSILFTTLPFFALVLCGYLAAHRRIVPESAIGGLNAFVLFFALPCLLFRFGMSTPVLELLNPSVLAVYLTAAALVVFFTIAMTLSRRVGMKDAAFGALVAAFPNTGFMGVPLLVALLGPQAAGPVICTILADMMITSSACLALAQTGQRSGQSPLKALLQSLKAAVSNPLPWSIAAGATLGVLQLEVPSPVLSVVNMLANAASPVALFTIGAVLWRSGQAQAAGAAPAQDHRERAMAMAKRAARGESVLVDPDASTMPSVWPLSDVGGAAPPHQIHSAACWARQGAESPKHKRGAMGGPASMPAAS
ncbi:AEC family transporter [Ideonella paludis]|uniref:AEC family transporter n=1 Tax=Ideonella paludis TaxID=1233411 RepID=UPI00362778A9